MNENEDRKPLPLFELLLKVNGTDHMQALASTSEFGVIMQLTLWLNKNKETVKKYGVSVMPEETVSLTWQALDFAKPEFNFYVYNGIDDIRVMGQDYTAAMTGFISTVRDYLRKKSLIAG